VFEPHAASPRTRLSQLEALIAGGVQTQARLDPILPNLTDSPPVLDSYFAALAQIGVRRVAAGVLFLRPAILYWLKRNVTDRRMLALLLDSFRDGQDAVMRGAEYPIRNLSLEGRREILARLEKIAAAHGIELKVCACKNPDLAQGSCNIAGTWPRRSPAAVQPPLMVG
jgi:DNA repair photolyase